MITWREGRSDCHERFEDGLDEVTGRELYSYSYRLHRADTGEELPGDIRHMDLVPTDEDDQ